MVKINKVLIKSEIPIKILRGKQIWELLFG